MAAEADVAAVEEAAVVAEDVEGAAEAVNSPNLFDYF
jgi:hypothetical protein